MLNRTAAHTVLVAIFALAAVCRGDSRLSSDPALRATIQTRALTAEIQAGLLRRLTHRVIGQAVVDMPWAVDGRKPGERGHCPNT